MNDDQLQSSPHGKESTAWTLCGILMIAGFIAALAVLPDFIEILQATGKQVVVWEFSLTTIAEQMVQIAIVVCIGMKLGPKVDLGTPLLTEWRSRSTGWTQQARSAMFAGLISGVGIGIALSLADPWLEGLMPPWPESARHAEEVAENMAAWKPLLASFSAGVTEELLFRYGLMTLLTWLSMKLVRSNAPWASMIWIANLLVALLFSLAHLTNVAELGIKITGGTILYLVITNGIASLIFGWLYWRRGLESAVFAHILADVVTKVIAPLLNTGTE